MVYLASLLKSATERSQGFKSLTLLQLMENDMKLVDEPEGWKLLPELAKFYTYRGADGRVHRSKTQ